ncbi:RsfA family transcriptional regulator [Piscibacillus halophilus]|uniref:Prespore-specific regulator n=1 Tax=Piscibacillus halophilus TaxID=571933 RepID=A0A1H9BU84_9BACI|nr:RsfA family transcriptional regulator [Piscibacillus halophilus]SEP92387.1 prespore-specific regulator [Piscibacillus halophilus]
MVKVRQDAWSHEDDLLLAETVLRHIREGSTQLNAFEEVGDQLNRTAAACGFRWNAEVRQNYEKAIDLAKRQRKQRKQAEKHKLKGQTGLKTVQRKPTYASTNITSTNEEQPTIDSIIAQLQKLKSNDLKVNSQEVEKLKEENERLKGEKETLENELEKMHKEYQSLQEDYQTFISIMERARKMVVLDDDSSLSSPTFKMEKNGNLQQIAK